MMNEETKRQLSCAAVNSSFIISSSQPGNSGGALVDERGNVIGIVSAKLDAGAALAASGALPEVLADGHQ